MALDIYNKLLEAYGNRGWWPLNNKYHPNLYDYPRNDSERFEICAGAVLTQNTSWSNVEKALINLRANNLLNPNKILCTDKKKLSVLIKPAGYYNQKTEYLFNLAEFFLTLKGAPSRSELLKVKGIGRETADSILLYAFNIPVFIVDAYTKRILNALGIIKSDNYEIIRKFLESNLPRDRIIFQEFHALLVEHAKKYYSKKPYGVNDVVLQKKCVKR